MLNLWAIMGGKKKKKTVERSRPGGSGQLKREQEKEEEARKQGKGGKKGKDEDEDDENDDGEMTFDKRASRRMGTSCARRTPARRSNSAGGVLISGIRRQPTSSMISWVATSPGETARLPRSTRS